MRKRSWTLVELTGAVQKAQSLRQVLISLNLKPAGGNYSQIKKYIQMHQLDTSHFLGKSWNLGRKYAPKPHVSLEAILQQKSNFQSYKLKNRLFQAGLKQPVCELCGWAKRTLDGRIPVELDHINGDNTDNRLENLRILCPNCHSLQPTHRGKNKARWRNR